MNTRWSLLMESLAFIERLSASHTGLYAYGVEPEGAIFVEHGRICWIAARGLERRLQDLLCVGLDADLARFKALCRHCREKGLLLGETLLAEGFLSPAELERALRQHSAESLRFLCTVQHPTTWRARAARGYSPIFTFLATDIFFEAVAQRFPRERARAETELAMFSGTPRSAVAYLLRDSEPELLPVAHLGPSDMGEMRELGMIATALFGAGHELGAEPSFSLSTSPSGEGIVIWRREGLLFAVNCTDRSSLAAATALRLEEA